MGEFGIRSGVTKGLVPCTPSVLLYSQVAALTQFCPYVRVFNIDPSVVLYLKVAVFTCFCP